MRPDQFQLHQIYQNLVHTLQAKGKTNPPQPSFLQSELLASSNQGSYIFPINQTDSGVIRSSERRLNVNDSFVCVAVGLYLKSEDPAKPGSAVNWAYPNATTFAAEAGNLATADLEAFFNSRLRIKVGDRVFIEAQDMSLGRVTNTTAATERDGTDGLNIAEPVITFDGSDKNEVTLTVPVWSGQQQQYVTATNRVYVVLKFWGFLVTGVSKLNFNNAPAKHVAAK